MTDHHIHHAPVLEAVMPRFRRPETRGKLQFTIPIRSQQRGSEGSVATCHRTINGPLFTGVCAWSAAA
jgi:hypothetical protein